MNPSVIKEISKKNQAKQTNSRKESLSESITKKNVPRIHLFISILTLFYCIIDRNKCFSTSTTSISKKESESLEEQIERVKRNGYFPIKIDTFGKILFNLLFFHKEKIKENYQSSLRIMYPKR